MVGKSGKIIVRDPNIPEGEPFYRQEYYPGVFDARLEEPGLDVVGSADDVMEQMAEIEAEIFEAFPDSDDAFDDLPMSAYSDPWVQERHEELNRLNRLYTMLTESEKKKKAGGGKIKKGISRRDFLKGAAAAGTAGALGAGVVGTKKGALGEADAARRVMDEVIERTELPAWSKQDMTKRQWQTIAGYLEDRLDDLYDELQYHQDRLRQREIEGNNEAVQRTLRDMQDVEAEIEQIEWIEGADEDYVFDPSAQEYLEEFVDTTINDLGLEIYDYGDFDDPNDPRVTHLRELERLTEPRRLPETAEDLDRLRDALESLDEPRPMGGLGPRKKPEMAGGGSVKRALKKLQEARFELEQSSDPDIELIGRSLMAEEDDTLRNVGQRIVRNEARVQDAEMDFEEAQKYYERISRLLDEAGAKLGEWYRDGRPDPGD